MKLHLKNHGERAHTLDRDIMPGQVAEYTEAQILAFGKAIANAAGTKVYRGETNETGGTTSKAHDAVRSELEIIGVEDDGKRTPLSPDDLRKVVDALQAKQPKATAPVDLAKEIESLKAKLAAVQAESEAHAANAEALLKMVETESKAPEKTSKHPAK